MGDRLRAYWDFGDLGVSEQRFRALLNEERTDAGRAEVLTQLARVEGLAERFGEGDKLLDEARALAGTNPLVSARVELERGRLRRSSGDSEAALPLFEAAFETATAIPHEFLAVDAAHMAAIAAPKPDARLAWTRRGIELADASSDPEVTYWLGPLLNNLGWDLYDTRQYGAALAAFERALAEREQRPEKPTEIAIARYAVAKTLRALGRPGEAAIQSEQAVAWAVGAGRHDGWFHEELAEDYAALGRDNEAAAQAHAAMPLLVQQDASFTVGSERSARLRELADRS